MGRHTSCETASLRTQLMPPKVAILHMVRLYDAGELWGARCCHREDSSPTRRSFIVVALLAGLVLPGPPACAGQGTAGRTLSNPFYAFDTSTGRDRLSLDEQAAMLKELGYAGIGFTGTEHISEMLKALDGRGLKMFTVYVGACVDAGKPPYDPGLKQAVDQLKGRDTLFSLFITGGRPSSTDRDDRAVAIIREIGNLAEKSGLRVALYPHDRMYVARVQDAVRIARKVDRRNVGVGFNLCHFLKTDDEKNLEVRLRECKPWLLAVSVNGADSGQTQKMRWNRLIQTLDRGTFDVSRLLNALRELGYTGPIGLQGYGIPGDPRENLRRSMDAWHRLTSRNRPRTGADTADIAPRGAAVLGEEE